MVTAVCQTTTIAALLFGSSYCLASSAVTAADLDSAAMAADADVTMIVAVATTAVSGSSYCFSSAAAVPASVLAAITAVGSSFC